VSLCRWTGFLTSAIAAIAVTAFAAACGESGQAVDSSSPLPAVTHGIEGEILVSAASSLTDAFTEAGKRFQDLNPKATVTFNFGSSASLATQIDEGVPVDVFASANLDQMKAVADRGNVGDSTIFATNSLVVVVPRGSHQIQSLRDLGKPGLKLVLAAAAVPAGQYAREALRKASTAAGYGPDFSSRVLANVRSEEANVRVVLAKVQLGEADAGIVYRTDVAAAGSDVTAIPIPPEFNVVATYPVAVVKGADNEATARAFVAFLLSPDGQAILQRFGFGPPG
jgi:molybdate transport system substrate-binding protein